MARPPKKSTATRAQGLPSRKQILGFIEAAPGKVGKREIARAFGIRGADRIDFKKMLREMADEGLIAGPRRKLRRPGNLPPVAVLEIIGRDEDGEYFARPATWDEDADGGPAPRLLIVEAGGRGGRDGVSGIGDRVLARIKALDGGADGDGDGGGDGDYAFEARPIKRLGRGGEARRMVGIFRTSSRGGGAIDPVDRRQLREWAVAKGDEGEARDGDLVRFTLTRERRYGLSVARVVEILGNPDDQRRISLIAVHAHGIPDEFSQATLGELENLPELDQAGRIDLSDVPLITIDPPDARDHDDAVWAAPDDDPKNRGGFKVTVAIADVAHYVREGTALDRSALERGNSVYFPDRVVAMLPEKISNDLCSLRQGEKRPCIAVRMVFDQAGQKVRHEFVRAIMRSHAKLSYEEAQALIDGGGAGEATAERADLREKILVPLWQAYGALVKARDRRAPLDLDLPERKIELDEDGRVRAIRTPERLDAHRLIEEFMIQSNVAAAETLEAKGVALIYRVHDSPAREKLVALRDFLQSIDITLARSATPKPEAFNRILARVKGSDIEELVNEVILRAQSQAIYAIRNSGHFGLNLTRYAHFTSPIRRYSDLVVHRALIRALGLGAGGLGDDAARGLEDIAGAVSIAERRAMAAERETVDRLIAAHLSERVGAVFPARISGVARSGLFVRLAETGADGFVPAATIGEDYFRYDERHHALVGDRSGETYRLGDRAEVRLVEAIPSAGALRFEILTPGHKRRTATGRRGKKPKTGRRRRG